MNSSRSEQPEGKRGQGSRRPAPSERKSSEHSARKTEEQSTAGESDSKSTPKQDRKRPKSSPSTQPPTVPAIATSRTVSVTAFPPPPPMPEQPHPTTTVAPAAPAPKSNVCYAFQAGKCHRGTKCRFEHTRESTLPTPALAPIPPAAPAATEAAVVPAPNQVPLAKAKQSTTKAVKGQSKQQKSDNVATESPISTPVVPPSPKRTSSAVEAENEIHMSSEEFRHLNISTASRKAIAEVMKYQYMTQVQAASLPVILEGKDCLAKAKTGTGKTLGFLIPSVELMLKNDRLISDFDVPTLVISPTRELAIQIAEEAKALLTFHARKQVVCLYGGVKITKDHRQLNQPNIALIVATPGRLNDHLQNTPGFGERLGKVRMVILDEADQLLDMGFKPAIDQIFRYLPNKEIRQTLLFSATVPKAVQDIANVTLRPGFAFVDTVGEVAAEQTHEHVPQELVILPNMTDLVPVIAAILRHQMSLGPNYKILVFFTTARVAGFMADLFNAMSFHIIEIHSRMSQSARTKASDTFRTGSRVVMFSSDVSARGMDYPDVTFVLQVGSTEKAQYIHRLGRTARAGKEGSGMLLLYSFEEQSMMKELKGLPLKRVQLHEIAITPSIAEQCQRTLMNVVSNADLKRSGEQAYQAWLGYYNGKLRVLSWSKSDLVQQAADYSRSCGLTEVPALEAKTIGKMGLKGTPGLRIAPFAPRK